MKRIFVNIGKVLAYLSVLLWIGAATYFVIDAHSQYPNNVLKQRIIGYNNPRIIIVRSKPIVIDSSSVYIPYKQVLVVGDSEAGFLNRKLHNMKFDNMDVAVEYIGGTVIDRWSKGGEFHRALMKHPDTDTVVILLGTNSYWRKELPDLNPILNEVGKRECYWLGPTRVQNKIWQFNFMLREAIEKDGRCKYIDMEELNPPLEDDQVHFKDPEGIYAVIDAVPIWSKKPCKE